MAGHGGAGSGLFAVALQREYRLVLTRCAASPVLQGGEDVNRTASANRCWHDGRTRVVTRLLTVDVIRIDAVVQVRLLPSFQMPDAYIACHKIACHTRVHQRASWPGGGNKSPGTVRGTRKSARPPARCCQGRNQGRIPGAQKREVTDAPPART